MTTPEIQADVPPPRRFQFSLRSLFILTTIVALTAPLSKMNLLLKTAVKSYVSIIRLSSMLPAL